MEGSEQRRLVGMQAALAALDMVSLLGLPASLLALARGHSSFAVGAAVAVTVTSATRAVLLGAVLERSMAYGWQALVGAAARRSVLTLRARPETEESVLLLMDGVHEAAAARAAVYPHIAATVAALAVLTVAVVHLLGPLWLLVGAAGLGVGGAFVAFTQSRLRPVQQRAWRQFGELVLDVRVLVDASAELRAHGQQQPFARRLLGRARDVARAERTVSTWAAVTSLLPAALAILALAAPVRAGVRWIGETVASERVAEVGVLGAAALMLGLSLIGNIQSLLRTRPLRAALAAFVAEPSADRSLEVQGGHGKVEVDRVAVELDEVGFRHASAAYATPAGATAHWPAGTGIAITGANGAGKSTLALVLLGLLRPTHGRVTVGGADLAALDLDAYRSQIAFVPQNAFVAPGIGVAWHLRVFSRREITDEAIDRALARVGLMPVLAEHARRTGCQPRDVLAGELSGGERQRMNLARALVQDARWVLLDEPEVGLDATGRGELRDILTELAAERRVLVIAHDESIIPDSFQRLRCVRGAREA